MQESDTAILNGESISIANEEEFRIDDTILDEETCSAPVMMAKYGRLSADFACQATTAKHRTDIKYAELAVDLREKNAQNKIKMTENALKEIILGDVAYQKVLAHQLQAERDAKKLDHLWRLALKRVDLIISLTYKQRTEIAKNAF